MDNHCYIFDYRTDKARLFRRGDNIYDLATGKLMFWIEGNWVFGARTGERTFWIDGKQLFILLGGSKLSENPCLYYGGTDHLVGTAVERSPALSKGKATRKSILQPILQSIRGYVGLTSA